MKNSQTPFDAACGVAQDRPSQARGDGIETGGYLKLPRHIDKLGQSLRRDG